MAILVCVNPLCSHDLYRGYVKRLIKKGQSFKLSGMPGLTQILLDANNTHIIPPILVVKVVHLSLDTRDCTFDLSAVFMARDNKVISMCLSVQLHLSMKSSLPWSSVFLTCPDFRQCFWIDFAFIASLLLYTVLHFGHDDDNYCKYQEQL